MTISSSSIKLALGTLQIARENWSLYLFSKCVYGDDYHKEHVGRQAYLKKKWEEFAADPLKFYFTLDLGLQRSLNRHLRTLVDRVAV